MHSPALTPFRRPIFHPDPIQLLTICGNSEENYGRTVAHVLEDAQLHWSHPPVAYLTTMACLPTVISTPTVPIPLTTPRLPAFANLPTPPSPPTNPRLPSIPHPLITPCLPCVLSGFPTTVTRLFSCAIHMPTVTLQPTTHQPCPRRPTAQQPSTHPSATHPWISRPTLVHSPIPANSFDKPAPWQHACTLSLPLSEVFSPMFPALSDNTPPQPADCTRWQD